MRIDLIIALCGLVGSAVLILAKTSRVLAAIALIASGIEVATSLGWIRLSVAGVSLGLVLGLCLAVPGLLAWLRASAKAPVSAATAVTLAGLLQIVRTLGTRL